jgi:predicted RNA-binding protein Jag
MGKKATFRDKIGKAIRDFDLKNQKRFVKVKERSEQYVKNIKKEEGNVIELARQKLDQAKSRVSEKKVQYVGREYLLSTIESLKFSCKVLRGRVLKTNGTITPSDFHRMSDNLIDIDDAYRYLEDVFANNRSLVSSTDMEILAKIGTNLNALAGQFSDFVLNSDLNPETKIIELCTKVEAECEDLRHHAADYFQMVS